MGVGKVGQMARRKQSGIIRQEKKKLQKTKVEVITRRKDRDPEHHDQCGSSSLSLPTPLLCKREGHQKMNPKQAVSHRNAPQKQHIQVHSNHS
jgi:hypothetical protein